MALTIKKSIRPKSTHKPRPVLPSLLQAPRQRLEKRNPTIAKQNYSYLDTTVAETYCGRNALAAVASFFNTGIEELCFLLQWIHLDGDC